MKLEALFNAVIVKPIEAEEEKYGSIVVPDMGKDKNERGEVVAVGPGQLLLSGSRGHMQCKVGDTVVFLKHSARKTEIDGDEYLIIREPDLETIIGD